MRNAPWRLRRALDRHPVRAGFAALAAAVTVAAALVTIGGPDEGSGGGATAPAIDAAALPQGPLGVLPSVSAPEAQKAPPGPNFDIARLWSGRHVVLRDAPGGGALARVGDETEFGLPRTFWIAARRGDWIGAHSPELANERLGWIRDDRENLRVYSTPYWLEVSLSAQRIELNYGRRTLRRIPVTVGAAGTETPIGDYAITDSLAGAAIPDYYGCCVLALSGHQTSLPAGWIGGDRIAIHGSAGPIGGAASHGCLRAGDRDLVALLARVPLGTPVFIRA